MSKGAKIAIGCAIAFVGAVGIAVVGILWGAYWFKGKVEEKVQEVGGGITAKVGEIARYQEKADANPYTPPADGVIHEDRLVKFLEVRKQMYAIYQAHQADIEAASRKKEADLTDIAKFGGLVADLELAKEKALAAQGMNNGEYVYMQMAVYKTQMGSELQKETGKQFGENVGEAARQNQDLIQKALEAAGKAGQPTTGVSDDQVKQAEDALQGLAGQAKAMDSPQANIDLFRKYQADIQKYAMGGLSFMGL